MPRPGRKSPGGVVYHVLNRANGKLKLFKKDDDYLAFEKVLLAAWERLPVRILDWCMMPTHWHLVLWPEHDGDLTQFLRWLTLTHAQRWKQAHNAVGDGHLYQGRFKSFPIQRDEHLLTVLRYVERNPVRTKQTKQAQDWRWGSCFARLDRTHELQPLLAEWPMERPRRWLETVNKPQSADDEAALKMHIERGRPYGQPAWTSKIAGTLELEHSLRPRGRPLGWRKRSVPGKAGK